MKVCSVITEYQRVFSVPLLCKSQCIVTANLIFYKLPNVYFITALRSLPGST